MRKYHYIILLVVLVFTACLSSTENDDKEPPIISDLSYSFTISPDTLMYSKTDSILINRDKDALIDTLIIGKSIYVDAHFRDNDLLSSYYISMDSVEYMPTDSIFVDKAYTFKKGYTSIFNKKEATLIKQPFTTIPDSIVIGVRTDTLATREGNYKLRIRCVDMAGNSTDSLGYTRDVKVFKRETLLQKLGH